MSELPPETRGPDERDELRAAELVERALARTRNPSESSAAQAPHSEDEALADAEELARLEHFLATCRTTLRADEAELDARLAERVLAATTREDLSLRGDFTLLRGWLTDSLRSSPLLRIVAASLLVHLFAVPVVAAILFFGPERRPPLRITWEPPVEDPFLPDESERLELDLPPDELPLALDAAPDPLAIANALRRARWVLTHGGSPAPRVASAVDSTSALDSLLARRATALAERDWSALETAPPLPSGADAGASGAHAELEHLAELLWLEAQLDRYALTGEVAPELGARFETLDPAAESARGALERDAVLRADAYGLLTPVQRERWSDALVRARSEAPRELPVDAGWLTRLERALPPGVERGPALDAWLAWRPFSEPAPGATDRDTGEPVRGTQK